MFAASPRRAVSQRCTLPAVGIRRGVGPIRRPADCKSAIRQIENLRYKPSARGTVNGYLREVADSTVASRPAAHGFAAREAQTSSASLRTVHDRSKAGKAASPKQGEKASHSFLICNVMSYRLLADRFIDPQATLSETAYASGRRASRSS